MCPVEDTRSPHETNNWPIWPKTRCHRIAKNTPKGGHTHPPTHPITPIRKCGDYWYVSTCARGDGEDMACLLAVASCRCPGSCARKAWAVSDY